MYWGQDILNFLSDWMLNNVIRVEGGQNIYVRSFRQKRSVKFLTAADRHPPLNSPRSTGLLFRL